MITLEGMILNIITLCETFHTQHDGQEEAWRLRCLENVQVAP